MEQKSHDNNQYEEHTVSLTVRTIASIKFNFTSIKFHVQMMQISKRMKKIY